MTLGTFLGNNINATDGQIAQTFSTQSWGAIVTIYHWHDRRSILQYRKDPRVLHLVGAGLMYLMANTTDFAGFTHMY